MYQTAKRQAVSKTKNLGGAQAPLFYLPKSAPVAIMISSDNRALHFFWFYVMLSTTKY